ncbi:MAG: 3-methyl-2-oxobutanoate hydroxymethyltransferase, partial [Planctomycetota bacterium]
DTLRVTMEEMLHHARAVLRGAPEALIIGDMLFLSYQCSVEEAIRNAGRFVKEGYVDAVKLEGGRERTAAVRGIIAAGIPVMGHLGLTPQSSGLLGGYRVQGTDATSAQRILEDAHKLEQAGVFSLVLECVPEQLGQLVTKNLSVATVGIGAGKYCDGQVLVIHDLLGIGSGYSPRFVRRYAQLEETMREAVRRFRDDVARGEFPGNEESFQMPAEERERLDRLVSPPEGSSTQDTGS